MASRYLAISFLKQTPLPEKQLRIFLSYLPQEPLKDYLFNASIYKGRSIMSKHYLIDMIITKKSKKMIYTRENDDFTKEEANELLKNKNFARQELLYYFISYYFISYLLNVIIILFLFNT